MDASNKLRAEKLSGACVPASLVPLAKERFPAFDATLDSIEAAPEIQIRSPFMPTHIASAGQQVDRFTIPACVDKLSKLRVWLKNTLGSHLGAAIKDEQISQIQLAVQEAAANIIFHSDSADADRTIDVEVSFADRVVAIELRYSGAAFEDASIPVPDFDGSRDHGFGLFIIQKIMDEVKYGQTPDQKNFIRLTKQLSPKEVGIHDRNGKGRERDAGSPNRRRCPRR